MIIIPVDLKSGDEFEAKLIQAWDNQIGFNLKQSQPSAEEKGNAKK
jgi:hypothetical protein